MTTKSIIKLFFLLLISCVLFFGAKGIAIAILSGGIVFAGFVLFCFAWGALIFLSDKFCD